MTGTVHQEKHFEVYAVSKPEVQGWWVGNMPNEAA